MNPHTTAEGAEGSKVILFASSQFDGGMLLVTGGNGVVDAEVVMEGVWPKLRFQVSTNEHGTDGIGDGEVTTLQRGSTRAG